MSNVPLNYAATRRLPVPQSPSAHSSPRTPMPVAVSYHDGAVLTFLFDRSTPIADLAGLIARAGTVRKVVL
ncbi:hypothetical protein GGI1_07357 [Acidithiobacillus sp. GGI-221]|nr:hypothetical protein GGI1_07357 [Acidithiobacillus sp. GGI-221]